MVNSMTSGNLKVEVWPTVDGSEILLSNWGWQFVPLFTRFYASQVVQDFWTINSMSME